MLCVASRVNQAEEEEELVCRAELQLRTRKNGQLFSAEILPLLGEDRVSHATTTTMGGPFSSSYADGQRESHIPLLPPC